LPVPALNETQLEVAFWKQSVLCAEIRERSQALLFFFSKAESQIFAVIAKQELLIEFWVATLSDPGNFCD
jgi:hypothetical protein